MPRRVPIPTSRYGDGDWPRVSNRAPLGWNAHLIRELHAPQIAHSLRVLYIVHPYRQVSDTDIAAEYKYMLSRGVVIGIAVISLPGRHNGLSVRPPIRYE